MIGRLFDAARFFASHPLTRGAQLGAWRRLIKWQIQSRMQGEVFVPWIDGQQLAVRRGMTGATGNIYAGLHDFAGMMLPLHFLRQGDLFLDIGANVGSYAVLASGVCGAHTWAFEPAAETVPHLKRNISVNGLDDLVVVFDLVLGAEDGEVRFSVGRDTVNHVVREATAESRVVQQRRLDTLIGARQPIMIKMDVEGHEDEVLRGAAAVLALPSLRIIALETVSDYARSRLSDHGFRIVYYDPFSRNLSDRPAGFSADTVFVRDGDFVAERLASARPIRVLNREI